MTRYSHCPRPRDLPAFPNLHLGEPSASALVAALRYLDATDSPYYLDLDSETNATQRPGAEPDLYLTDRAFAKLVRDRCVETLAAAGEVRNDCASSGATEASGPSAGPCVTYRDDADWPSAGMPEAAKLPRLVSRNTVRFNDQVLRTGAFAGASLGSVLHPVGDREGFEVVVDGHAVTQRHLDVLLYLLSRVPNDVDTKLAVSVPVPERRMLMQMGWGVNTKAYQKLRLSLHDLGQVRLTLRDVSRRQGVQLQGAQLLRVLEHDRAPGPAVTRLNALDAVVLTPDLLRLATMGRLAVIDLSERWCLPRGFTRWLHAFVSTQRRGLPRVYPALELYQAGGLRAGRTADRLAALRRALRLLEEPRSALAVSSTARPRDGATPGGNGVIAPGWTAQQIDAEWLVTMARSAAPQVAT